MGDRVVGFPGLLAALAIIYAIRHTTDLHSRERGPLKLRIAPCCGAIFGDCSPESQRSNWATVPPR
jgi:hypothetical protein